MWRDMLLMVHVALRKESVDRNPLWPRHGGVPLAVALRKESVDRNLGDAVVHSGHAVALRKESVDRNPCPGCERMG